LTCCEEDEKVLADLPADDNGAISNDMPWAGRYVSRADFMALSTPEDQEDLNPSSSYPTAFACT
jgi:hypothetical protein